MRPPQFTLPATRLIVVTLCLLLGCVSGCTRGSQTERASMFTHEILPLVLPPNATQSSLTFIGGRVAALGDATAPGLIHLMDPITGDWTIARATVPKDLQGGVMLRSSTGTLLLDKNSGGQVYLLRPTTSEVEIVPLGLLPSAFRATAATVAGGTVYLAGRYREGTSHLFRAEVDRVDVGWVDLGEVPSTVGDVLALVIQSNGERPHLFFFGHGPTAYPDIRLGVTTYEPGLRQWRRLDAAIEAPDATVAVPVGIANIYLLSPGGRATPSSGIRVFNSVTRVWTKSFDWSAVGQPLAAFAEGPRVRTLAVGGNAQVNLVTSTYHFQAHGLQRGDYIVIAIFVGILLIMGLFSTKRFRSAESFFRGGKRIPWLAAGLSVVATGQSATSFISIPSRGFATNWQFSLVPLTNVFGGLIMSRYFVRFFVRLNVTTAYEYLQARFSPFVRTLGSVNYLAYELTRISLLILLPAVAITAVTRIEIATAIVLMGAIATLYTALGGLEGVIWADVGQVLIKITAIFLVLGLIFFQLKGDPLDLAATAWREGKLHAVDWSFDLTRTTIWAMLLFWFTDGLKSYVANQTIIQRFLSTRDERAARRSILASALFGTLIFWIFMLVGTGLFLFYRQNPERLDLAMDKPDAIFPWFIMFELPPGVTGFLITALMAAALSALYGALNSSSTVIVTDFYRRFLRGATDGAALRLGRTLTVIIGALATGLSLLLAGFASSSLVERTLGVVGLFGGGLGGLFLAGMLTTRIGTISVLVGFCASAVVQYYVSLHTSLHWLTYMFTGMGTCLSVAYLASFVWPEGRELKGLTVHTTALHHEETAR